MNLTKTVVKIYLRWRRWPASAAMTTGPPDGAGSSLAAVEGGMKQPWSRVCLLTALGTKPTSLQITALVKCIEIITTQRPSLLLLWKQFLDLLVIRKHFSEGGAPHKFRASWIYRRVARGLWQVAISVPSLQGGAWEGLLVRIWQSQKTFQHPPPPPYPHPQGTSILCFSVHFFISSLRCFLSRVSICLH